MGAIIMNGVVIGAGSVVGAGALLPEGLVVPPRSLVLGMPAKVRRETTDEEVAGNRNNAATYVARATVHRP
jgi:carbonic anhydrase/acetyltransferase-like protein (isoleucine patch superfamily)